MKLLRNILWGIISLGFLFFIISIFAGPPLSNWIPFFPGLLAILGTIILFLEVGIKYEKENEKHFKN
jgi:hypothetical protein